MLFFTALIYLNIRPLESQLIGPANSLLLGLIVPCSAFTIFSRLLIFHFKSFRFWFFTLATIVVCSLLVKFSESKICCEKSLVAVNDRISITTYVEDWIHNLDTVYPQDSTIYLVASKGGGIRAAAWTNLILGKYVREKDSFARNCLALTGSSGGMVGQGLFVATEKSRIKMGISHFESIKEFYLKEDFLSPSLVRLFVSDLFNKIPFVSLKDRHEILELSFRNHFESVMNSKVLSCPLIEISKVDSVNNNPLLISNCYDATNHRLGFLSSVSLSKDFSESNSDLLSMIEKCSGEFKCPSLITSVLESARFPLMSPKGTIDSGESFRDAGYYDNWGGLSMVEIINNLKLTFQKNPNWQSKYSIKVILLDNLNVSSTVGDKGVFGDVFASRSAHANKEMKNRIINVVKDLQNEMEIAIIGNNYLPSNFDLSSPDKNKPMHYPLGWFISNSSFENLVNSVENIKLDY